MRSLHFALMILVALVAAVPAGAVPVITVQIDDCSVSAVALGQPWGPAGEAPPLISDSHQATGSIFLEPQQNPLSVAAHVSDSGCYAACSCACSWSPTGVVSVSTSSSFDGFYWGGAHANATVHWRVAVGPEPFNLSVNLPENGAILAEITNTASNASIYSSTGPSHDTVMLAALQTYDLWLQTPGGALPSTHSGSITFQGDVVPEPATLSLLALGGMAMISRRKL